MYCYLWLILNIVFTFTAFKYLYYHEDFWAKQPNCYDAKKLAMFRQLKKTIKKQKNKNKKKTKTKKQKQKKMETNTIAIKAISIAAFQGTVMVSRPWWCCGNIRCTNKRFERIAVPVVPSRARRRSCRRRSTSPWTRIQSSGVPQSRDGMMQPSILSLLEKVCVQNVT